MTNTKYNGWTNRETWVYNLHMGDALLSVAMDQAEDGYFDDADSTDAIHDDLENISSDFFLECMEQCLNGSANASMVWDLIDEDAINHEEIAEHLYEDVIERLIELCKEGDYEEDELPEWYLKLRDETYKGCPYMDRRVTVTA